jgi:cobalt-zinc-cadmium efflux system outer membrane protein
MAVRTFVLATLAWSLALPVCAQTVLTLDGVLRRARETSGPVTIARARIAEAASSRADAAARFGHNPVVETQAGPRAVAGPNAVDLAVGLSQQFETGGQQRARRAVADAATARAGADAAAVTRDVLLDAGERFLEGLAALERLAAAEAADVTSRELLAANERRYALGDIAAVDLNLARIEAARTGALLATARAELAGALGRLRTVLRIPPDEPLRLEGSLATDPPPPIDALTATLDARADLRVFDAEREEADATVALGRGMARPDVGVRLGYEREDRDHVVRGGLTLTLPVFQRGATLRAEGSARAARARLEQELLRETALAELRTSRDVLLARQAAVGQADAMLPALADNDTLARRSYEAGEMNLMNLLQLRRDAVALRDALVQLRLAAARERLRLDSLAGGLQ